MKTNNNRLLRVGENIRAVLSTHIISNKLYIKQLKNVIITSIIEGNDKEAINQKINTGYDKIISEIKENSNIQIITKNRKKEDIIIIVEELILDHIEQSNLRRIESLEQKLINNLDENSYSELIKLKSQLNRE